MNYKMIKTLSLIAIISCFQLLDQACANERHQDNQKIPTKSFGTKFKIPVTKTCLDGDFVRTKNTYNGEYLFEPLSRIEELDLGGGRIIGIKKTSQTSYTIKNGFKSEPYELEACQKRVLAFSPDFNKREATAQERLVLGALYQRGISQVSNPSPSLEKIIQIYNRGNKPQKRVFFESDYCQRGFNSPGENLLRLGGEGSGKGKVIADININLSEFERLRLEPSRFLGLFETNVPLSEYILDGQTIPQSIIGVSCQ